MIAKLAQKYCNCMEEKGIIQKEEAALYQYGIENGIVIAGNLLASVILGMAAKRLDMVLVFLLFYSVLRSYSGGIHCNSRKVCFLLSLFVLCIPVYTYSWVRRNIPYLILVFVGILAVFVIFFLSPIESKKKPLRAEERKFFQQVSRYLVLIQACGLIFLYCLQWFRYFYAGYSSLVLIAVFLVLGKIHAKCYT